MPRTPGGWLRLLVVALAVVSSTLLIVGVPVLSPNVDIANVRIHFANGTVANLTASRVSLKRTRKIRFFQPDVYVSIDYDDREVLILRRTRNPQSGAYEISGEQQKVPEGDALEDELRAFIRSVKTREPL